MKTTIQTGKKSYFSYFIQKKEYINPCSYILFDHQNTKNDSQSCDDKQKGQLQIIIWKEKINLLSALFRTALKLPYHF